MADTKMGRPPRFETPEQLEQIFQDWKLEFKSGGVYEGEIPDVECFCDYIDSYRDLFSEYGNKPEFSDTIKRIKNWIYYKKKQLAMQNKMPVAMFIFDAINNTSYANKVEQDLTTGGDKLSPVLVRFVGNDSNDGNTDTQGV